jgi:hypothetical protein
MPRPITDELLVIKSEAHATRVVQISAPQTTDSG